VDYSRNTRGNGGYMQLYEVIDNFLDKEDFRELSAKALGRYFPWFHYDEIVRRGEKQGHTFYSMHMLYDNDRPTFNTSFELMNPVLKKLRELKDERCRLSTLIRVKMNSYPNQGTLIEHDMHVDWPSSTSLNRKACLFSINTCNGYTKLDDGTKVDSVANRALLFDPTIPHCSSTTTNDTRRVNINFNYF